MSERVPDEIMREAERVAAGWAEALYDDAITDSEAERPRLFSSASDSRRKERWN